MFEKLSDKPIAQVQKEQAERWEKENLLKRCVETRKDRPSFIFYEGPPTANGHPGIHHVIARTLKDSVCRYKTMQGFEVKRKAGWDTHGLPVEIEVERELSMSGKQDIEQYGIKAFNRKCRESVFKYESTWREMTKRMGFLIDMDDPYITLEDDYIESCWWIIQEFFKAGLLYEGHKILPYCPRCGTGLASHEVALGYKEVKVNTVVAQFKRKDADEYFLAWTTTPWTLASNVALTVGPDVDYIKAKMKDGSPQAGQVVYCAAALADKVLGAGVYEVLEEMKGSALEYMEYEQLMPFVRADQKAFFLTCGDYVTVADGTGIVHTAPAFGEDDYRTGRKYDLPVMNPVDDQGRYTETPWSGRVVTEEALEVDIIKWLAAESKLFAKEKMTHNYPHCWRCGIALIYYAKPSWYIEMTKLKDQLVANNNQVNWFPDFIGEKRFGNWLENVNDWAISRNRFWGTPIPIWRCACGKLDCIGSRAELFARATAPVAAEFELHRPYVDEIEFICPDCGGKMHRIPEVMDCWFDSGAMPFAQHHYPFENKERFEAELFPADFVCEGIDQTRGWFYSLIAISTFIKGTAPYRNVLVNDLILDKEGKKMSKTKGNTVDPFELFDKYGADATRWYLLHVSPVWAPTRFDEEGLMDVVSKFFGTLRNVYNFFALYANEDAAALHTAPSGAAQPEDALCATAPQAAGPLGAERSAGSALCAAAPPYAARPELDRWILSKYNRMIADVTEEMERYDHMKAVRKIQDFVTEDLSNWYIRRARRRFWEEGMTASKQAVYATTYEVLVGVARLAAPFAPFLTDEMYTKLTGEESVHIAFYPKAQQALIDENAESRMDLVRNLVALGREAREKERIKVRQPLSGILVDGAYEAQIGDLTPLIREELNVKRVIFAARLDDYMDYSLKPNFKVAGPALGAKIKAFGAALAQAASAELVAKLERDGKVELVLDGETAVIDKAFVEIKISAKDGFAAAMENNVFVILDTTITAELEQEGLVRELISKVQQIRKQQNFEMMDKIRIFLDGDEAIQEAACVHRAHIMKETLAVDIDTAYKAAARDVDINGHITGIRVERI